MLQRECHRISKQTRDSETVLHVAPLPETPSAASEDCDAVGDLLHNVQSLEKERLPTWLRTLRCRAPVTPLLPLGRSLGGTHVMTQS